jgi:hypothetical protein
MARTNHLKPPKKPRWSTTHGSALPPLAAGARPAVGAAGLAGAAAPGSATGWDHCTVGRRRRRRRRAGVWSAREKSAPWPALGPWPARNAGDLLGSYVGCWKLVKTYWSGWNMIQIEWWRETILFEEWFFKALGSRPAWCWGDGNTCDVFFLKLADFRKLRSCPSGSWGFFHWTITGGADLPLKLNSSMASFEHAFSRLGWRGWIWQACYLLRQRTSATGKGRDFI